MTVYTVIGHPLGNPPDQPAAVTDDVRAALQITSNGATVNLTLPAPTATELQNIDVLQ